MTTTHNTHTVFYCAHCHYVFVELDARAEIEEFTDRRGRGTHTTAHCPECGAIVGRAPDRMYHVLHTPPKEERI